MTKALRTSLDCGGTSRIRNLPTPVDPGDAVSLGYLNEASAQVISEDLTVTGTCVMFGPVSVAQGKAVTIAANSKWVVYQ